MIFPKESGLCRFFLDTLVRGGAVPLTDAPDSFVLAGALYALATAVLDKTTFPVAGSLVTPTFAGVLVAPPVRYRRSTIIHLATHVIEEFEEQSRLSRRGPDDFSADALIEHMGQGTEYQNVGLTFATDFESFLSGGQAWNERARSVLCGLLDGRGEFRSARAKTQLTRIERPRLAILTALNPKVLADLPKAHREFSGGLMSRLLPIPPADDAGFEVGLGYQPARVQRPRTVSRSDLAKGGELLNERWKATTAFEGWEPDAGSLFDEWDNAHNAWLLENYELNHGLYGDVLAALPMHVVRLACLYQVDINPEASTVTLTALEYAMELARVVRHGITQLASPRSGVAPINTSEVALNQVLRALHSLAMREGGVYAPVAGARLYDAVRLSKRTVDEAVDDLIAREIVAKNSKGRGFQIQFLHAPSTILARLLGRPEKSEVVLHPVVAMNTVLRLLHDRTATADGSGYEPVLLSRLAEGGSPLSEEDITTGVRELAWNEIVEVVKIGLGRRLRIVLPPDQVLARLAAGEEPALVTALPSTPSRLRVVESVPRESPGALQSFGTTERSPAPQSRTISGEQSGTIYESDEEYANDVLAWELSQRDEA